MTFDHSGLNRRDLMKVMATLAGSTTAGRLLASCARPKLETAKAGRALGVYPPNFGLLASDGSWRTTWTHIVPGKFTASSYSSLFFYDASSNYGEFWATDGNGGLAGTSPFATWPVDDIANQAWTHVVPGYFGPSGLMGLLFYDKATGDAAFYDWGCNGALCRLQGYGGWRTSWTQIVPGYFASPAQWDDVQPSETYTDLFFYSPSEQQAQIWTTDGTGNITLKGGITYTIFNTFTHVVGGDFVANSDDDQYTDLFFYDANTGTWRIYYTRFAPQGTELLTAYEDAPLPTGLSAIIPGNFGGPGSCDVALFTASTGALSFRTVRFDPGNPATPASLVELETETYPRSTASIVVPGNFWMRDPDVDHWFFDGDNQTNEQLRSWRAAAGGFADLLFYNASLGLGETYFHEPLLPPPDPLTGYATSTSQHSTRSGSTGSVLPGETVSFHVSSQVGPYTISILRADDATETSLATISGLPSSPSPLAVPPLAYRDGAQWPAVGSLSVPSGWTSGLYLARVRATNTSDVLDIPFVVRSPNPGQNAILVVIADATYEAYNDWGGRSLYGYSNVADGEPASATAFAPRGAVYPQGGMRAPYAFTVSFDRPHDGRYETHGHKWTYWEKPLLQWLTAQGFTVDVCTMRDLGYDDVSAGYRVLVFPGHPEYWTYGMRFNVQNWAAAGGNVVFMSGNVCWWQVRNSTLAIEADPDGTKLSCTKNPTFDPLSTGALSIFTTVNWEAQPVALPETALTGVSYEPNKGPIVYPGPTPFTVAQGASHDTLLRGCAFVDGSTFGLYAGGAQSVVGPETDRVQPTTPANFMRLATAAIDGVETASMGYFFPGTGTNRTMTTATMDWTLGLSLDGIGWSPIDQISYNMLMESILGRDLAFGSRVTVWSSYEAPPGFSKANLTDGNRRSAYSSQVAEQDPTKAVNHSEWIVITLPTTMTFSKVVLYPRNDAPYVGQGFPIDFHIQVWNGLKWIDRVVVTGAPLPGAQAQVFSWGFSDRTNLIRLWASNLRTVAGHPQDGYLLQLAGITVHA
jgi:hypothetical protein